MDSDSDAWFQRRYFFALDLGDKTVQFRKRFFRK